ncbi:MAG: DUF3298 domain-containing protein [Parabacteroides sp.]|nr:DUF3298 domain-containing protein [Parabacteroides sp.]
MNIKTNKYCLFLLLIFLTTLGFSACGVDSGTTGNGNLDIQSTFIQEEGEHLDIDVEIPKLSGFPNEKELNEKITSEMEAAVAEVKDAAAMMSEQGSNFSATLHSNYQYFNSEDIASVWISWDNYTGGAHGLYWIDSYTFNTATGELYSFPQLFKEGSRGLENVINKIIKEIESNDSYFETAVETVNSYGGNFNFLINGDQIIVYFPLYEIAPYVAGIQGFTFTLEELAQDLKPEITNAMEGQEPKEILYLQREP